MYSTRTGKASLGTRWSIPVRSPSGGGTHWIALGASTAGNYLKAFGFTPQKPVRRAFEQSSAAVARWLQETYPAIHARAKAEGAEIYWADEMGLRSDHQAGRSWSPRGR